jgi:hypothetical protein
VLAIGGTYALFSANVKTNVHLQSATLSVDLYRVEYTTKTLQDNGTLKEEKDSEPVNLKENADKLFDISEDDLIVPGTSYAAKLQISSAEDNKIAFDYGVRLLDFSWKKEGGQDGEKLAEQIRITITNEDGDVLSEFMLSEADGKDVNIGSITLETKTSEDGTKVDNSQIFTIKAEFVDDEKYATSTEETDDSTSEETGEPAAIDESEDSGESDESATDAKTFNNNDAQGLGISFDVQVFVMQKVS